MTWLAEWVPEQDAGQVTPLDDLRAHDDGPGCWCAPEWVGDVLVHSSLDCREVFEVTR